MDQETSPKRLRILIVDDEPGVREILTALLTNEGYETSTADSGFAALEEVERFHPHLAFLDIRMPDMDGMQCLRRIKELAPETEVIMISGFATMDMARRSLEIGAFDYIGKPFDFDHIRETVRQTTVTRFSEFM